MLCGFKNYLHEEKRKICKMVKVELRKTPKQTDKLSRYSNRVGSLFNLLGLIITYITIYLWEGGGGN